MGKKKLASSHMDRLSASLAASFPDLESETGHGYELSSSFSLAEKRRLLGEWRVVSHMVDNQEYTRYFIANTLRGAELLEPLYQSSYLFMDGICVRRSSVSGTLLLPDSHSKYCFRMNMALQWVLEPQALLIRPVMAYQYASLDDQPAAVKDLGENGDWQRIVYCFSGDDLLFSDKGDEKRLQRNF